MIGHFCGRLEVLGTSEKCSHCNKDGPNFEYLHEGVDHPGAVGPLSGKISFHKVIEKSWGKEIVWTNAQQYLGKFLHIRAGHGTSIHYHNHKDEVITLISGEVEVRYFDRDSLVDDGSIIHTFSIRLDEKVSARIRPQQMHQIYAITDCVVAEASTMFPSDSVRVIPSP